MQLKYCQNFDFEASPQYQIKTLTAPDRITE